MHNVNGPAPKHGGSSTLTSPTAPTPTKQIVETSVGVREAAKNLQKLSVHWESPRNIVIITKPDKKLIENSQAILSCLLKKGMSVYVEDAILPQLKKTSGPGELKTWNANRLRASITGRLPSCASVSSVASSSLNISDLHHDVFNPEDIDLVITLGGDGTVLYASWLFQTCVPPILPFHLGTLGFLTVFDFCNFRSLLDRIITAPSSPDTPPSSLSRKKTSFFADKDSELESISGLRLTLRMRLNCAVYRCKTILSSKCRDECSSDDDLSRSLNNSLSLSAPAKKRAPPLQPIVCAPPPAMASETIPEPDEVYQILNDLVVDRGPSAYMSLLEVFCDGRHLTTVQADGMVVSTPTGSTAYSLSAGGSLVHPEVPAILVTPICPHTLSFRPMQLPDSMELKIVVPFDARNGAWASFDGKHRLSLHQGDAIVITASPYSVPTICRFDQTKDWFDSLSRCLRWNDRPGRQKSFVWGQGVVEDEKDEEQSMADLTGSLQM